MNPAECFSSGDAWLLGRLALVQQKLEYGSTSAVLIAPTASAKTTLAFEYSRSRAEKGESVLFVCPSKEKLHKHPPLPFKGQKEPTPQVLKRIEIKYIDDITVLQTFLVSLHTLALAPASIIIDDFGTFCPPPNTSDEAGQIARTCAFLVEAANYCTSQRATQGLGACTVLVTDTPTHALIEAAPTQPCPFDLYTRWFPLVLRVQERQGIYTMRISQSPKFPQDPHDLCFTVKVADGAVTLESVEITLESKCDGKTVQGALIDLHVVQKYYNVLASGEKTVEGRLCEGSLEHARAGDYLLMNGSLLLRIPRVANYKSFHEYLNTEGVQKCIPGAQSVDEGVAAYRQFYSEAQERQCGVLAFEVERVPFTPPSDLPIV